MPPPPHQRTGGPKFKAKANANLASTQVAIAWNICTGAVSLA